MRTPLLLLCLAAWAASIPSPASAQGQDRDAKVRKDREAFKGAAEWIYNDLDEATRVAKAGGRPLMVVFRCIPCEACQEFDDDVARRDPTIRDLMDRFVCVRIVQANRIDLTRFRYDFDQSFAVILMHPDGTTYGRFGTRSARPEWEDISLPGLRKAMEGALRLHEQGERARASLAKKQVAPGRFKTPPDYPSLAGKYGASLDYEGKVARSCMHCHQIGEADRRVYRDEGKPIPDEVLYPFPDPSALGLSMDPGEAAKVARVAPGSVAETAGLRPGDEVEALDGQPLLSIADLQWVLHNTGPSADLSARVRRDGATREAILALRPGWRRGDLSWRATSWELRRMALGGMRLDEATGPERSAAKVDDRSLALKVRHVGQYAPHDRAKAAGLKAGDVIVSFDGIADRRTESDLLAHALQERRPGDSVEIIAIRDGERQRFKITLQ